MRTLATLLSVLLAFGAAAAEAVSVAQDNATFTLDNGIISARVSKRSGDLMSLKYNGTEVLGAGSGHPGGYWSHSAAAPKGTQSISIDPAANNGERAEVSVKGFCEGKPLGTGPGGSVIADIEIRYALARGSSALYTYCIFDHPAALPATQIGEARFCAKLNGRIFDWMTIDAKRNKKMPAPEDWDNGTQLNMKEARRMTTGIYKGQVEHKYDYSAIQFDIPAFGWSSTQKKIGLWFVNPSIEYLSGGATKVELTGHLDNNAGAAPTVLNYWRGSHYGGSRCEIEAGEAWTKVIGPFLIYCNSVPAETKDEDVPGQLWKAALKRAAEEAEAWPYEWVVHSAYPGKMERGTVAGQIVLRDDFAKDGKLSNLRVGLAHNDYAGGRAPRAGKVDWQQDAKYYQFWTRADDEGRFTIKNVRPGEYTLHAIADNVLGEFAQAKITVAAEQKLDMGKLEWTPVRNGTPLWEIGIPNRSAEEFFHGDHYWQWGLYNEYPKDFPDDVNFTIGKSDFKKDWNYCQCPRPDRPDGTVWTITFENEKTRQGRATLRLAIAAASARGGVKVSVNGSDAGGTGPLMDTATIRRDGIRGYWTERSVAFDAALLKAGTNTIKLTVPPGNAMNGVEWDYLRLEVQEK